MDRVGFEAWLAPQWDAMARLAARLSPAGAWEDVLQDAVLLAWRKRDRYDDGRGTPRAWLLALVADCAGKARRRRRDTAPLPDVAEPQHDPDLPLDVARALTQLSPRQRLAVELHYFLQLPIAEVAEVMGTAPGTVKSTLADARRRLRSELANELGSRSDV